MTPIAADEVTSPDEGVWVDPVIRPRRASRSVRRRVIVVAIVLACAVGFLLYKGVSSAVVYFKTADEAIHDRASLGNASFDIEGTVVAGSISKASGTSVTFAIASGHAIVHVHNTGVPPELFQANVPVVLVGHFVGSTDEFSSNQILVKHSNQYIAAHPTRVRAPNGSVR